MPSSVFPGGTGTVTSTSVTTANGISGSVGTATTTPAIELTLGAITPTSVAATGDVKGATFHVGSDAGVDGTGTTITAITVKKGIITAITVS